MKKTYDIKILSSKTESKLYFHNPTEALRFDDRKSDLKGINDYQHLYIISDEAATEGGIGWDLSETKFHPLLRIVGNSTFAKEGIKNKTIVKLIASSDKSLTPDSWIPDSFIRYYVEEYHNRKLISEVMLEVALDENIKDYPEFGGNGIPKTSEDGSVIIHKQKTYSEEEVFAIAQEAWIESFFTKRNTDITGFEEWKNKFIK